jgi:hypothetical protein
MPASAVSVATAHPTVDGAAAVSAVTACMPTSAVSAATAQPTVDGAAALSAATALLIVDKFISTHPGIDVILGYCLLHQQNISLTPIDSVV